MITHFVYGAKVWGCSDTFSPYLFTGELHGRTHTGTFSILMENGEYRYANAQNVFYDETEACIHASEIATFIIRSYYRNLTWYVKCAQSGSDINFLINIKKLLRAIESDKIAWDNLKEQYGELLPTFKELRE